MESGPLPRAGQPALRGPPLLVVHVPKGFVEVMLPDHTHVTDVTAAAAVMSPWLITFTGEVQLVLALLGIVWLALQITLKILSIRKTP